MMNEKTNVLGVYPMQHQDTKEEGTIYIIANKNSAFYGLSFFFESEKTNTQEYIGSFVLTHEEAKSLTEGYSTTARDLSYIMTAQNSYLDILKLTNLKTYVKDCQDPYYNEELISRTVFELNVEEFQWTEGELRNEYLNNSKMCGIRLAIVDALKNANVVKNTGNAIVNYFFPLEAKITIRNYKMEF